MAAVLALIRGAGDIATGIALRLYRSGILVVMTDLPRPTAIRRTVAFSDAITCTRHTVEDVTAVRAENAAEAFRALEAGLVPVLPDPELSCLSEIHPDVLVDAILAKRNLGTTITMAPAVIGVGPGFTAGRDCHAVVETMRGHDLGRVILHGCALPNTNIPGLIGGFAGERVLRAPKDGVFHQSLEIGAAVAAGDAAGYVDGEPVVCHIAGVLRGILPDGVTVTRGMKSGDVDPRGDAGYCRLVSDKAMAVGGGVLEACLRLTGALKKEKMPWQTK